MKSSTGAHYIALDHVRALAAFFVFTWHFTHASNGTPVSLDYTPPIFPLALLDEGHTGVALFMVLSGYLFAKLLEGRSIHYGAFLWNRALRLLPLLFAVVLFIGFQEYRGGESMAEYARFIAGGTVLPTLPNGGWSITVEFHYYLILPLFLWMLAKARPLPLSIIAAAIALRVFLYFQHGEIQSLAYWTLLGRVDQFALGMLAYQYRAEFTGRHVRVVGILTAFTLFYWYFDRVGGFYRNPSYPSSSPLWIWIPTIEGVAYAAAIAWYDNSFAHSPKGISRLIGRMGEFSYSIYLLHFFVVFDIAHLVNTRVMDISNFYVACLWSAACFCLMMPVGYLSYRLIESPFLKLRRRYIVAPSTAMQARPIPTHVSGTDDAVAVAAER